MPSTVSDEVTLDHVAHAAGRWQDLWGRYAVDFGAEWVSGGTSRGFAPGQLRFRNGARLEMLMPWDVHVDDFLARFLDRSGSGPHHLTFKVGDLGAALDEVRQAGFEPIGVDLSNPEWMEAFIHPKQATGVVVQLAESAESADSPRDDPSWATPAPEGFPHDRRALDDGSGGRAGADLEWVVHAVADPALARALFVDVLHGTMGDSGHVDSPQADAHAWANLSWGGPLGVRLIWPIETVTGNSAPEDLTNWLAGRPGRVHHLELRVDEPAGVPGAVPATDGACRSPDEAGSDWWEVPAADNAGLRLVLRGTR